MPNQMARTLNASLGVWLFLSAFLWIHTPPQRHNTWLVGLLAFGTAWLAQAIPPVRFLNMALALWLFLSVWALPRQYVLTGWNNAVVAVGMFWLSLQGGIRAKRAPGPHAAA